MCSNTNKKAVVMAYKSVRCLLQFSCGRSSLDLQQHHTSPPLCWSGRFTSGTHIGGPAIELLT
jgi:hypothetical protein